MNISPTASTFSNIPRSPDNFVVAARIGFAATLIFIPFRWRFVILARPDPQLYRDYTDFLLFAPDIFMLASLAFWGLSLLTKRRKISLGPFHIWGPLLGLTLVGWLSIIQSYDVQLTIYHSVRFSLLYLFYLLIVNEIRSPTWVVIPVALQMLIQSVIGILQSILQHDLGLQFLGEHDLDPLRAGTSVLEAGSVRFLRAYGLTDHPNILGGCLAFGLLILLAAFIHSIQTKEHARSWLIALVFVTACVALLVTFSRSAWIALLCVSLLIFGIQAWQKDFIVLKRVAILALACFLLAFPFIYRDRFFLGGRFNLGNSFSENRVERGSINERILLVDVTNHIFLDHALTGIGLGVSALAMQQAYPVFPTNYQPPHLTLLAAALETGIFGAAFFLILTGYPILILILRLNRLYVNEDLIASGAVLLSILIVGLFDYYTWGYTAGRDWQWLAWGIWASAWNNRYAVD